MDTCDLLVIGGGVNGAGIARDAAGRGLRTVLCEKDDLAEGTSSRSSKLIHGGLRYLEQFEFRLVREALRERDVLLRIAPHIVWPMRFVIPHARNSRPKWLIRLGLFLYDHLGGRSTLPHSVELDLQHGIEGRPVQPRFRTGFAYSDCWVEDARLVVLNALDAAAHGADIRVGTEAVSAVRTPSHWTVTLRDAAGERTVQARAIVNAAGPWVAQVLDHVAGVSGPASIRLVKGSHLVVRKFWDGPQAYLLQHADKRVIFVIPYAGDLALIGTTDTPLDHVPGQVTVSPEERTYLLDAVNQYMAVRLRPADIQAEYAGIRPLYDDKSTASAATVTRDYRFELDAGADRAPLLSIFGGKITTYRKLAEHALARLAPLLPQTAGPWTATQPLPGGDIADFPTFAARLAAAHPWLPDGLAHHYARLYGTRADALLHGATSLPDLGQHFGSLLYAREADFLRTTEWARHPDDVLDRRTRHGLHLTAEERARFTAWWTAGHPAAEAPAPPSMTLDLDRTR